jgi:CheY-like chemotaxis protein
MKSADAQLQTRTILVVDDDSDQLDEMSQLLDKRGYETLQACNGQIALNLLREMYNLPFVIILDMAMPVLDGLGFLERRAGDAILRRIPVIVLSSSPPPPIPLKNVEAYLRKPVSLERLMSLIESSL